MTSDFEVHSEQIAFMVYEITYTEGYMLVLGCESPRHNDWIYHNNALCRHRVELDFLFHKLDKTFMDIKCEKIIAHRPIGTNEVYLDGVDVLPVIEGNVELNGAMPCAIQVETRMIFKTDTANYDPILRQSILNRDGRSEWVGVYLFDRVQ